MSHPEDTGTTGAGRRRADLAGRPAPSADWHEPARRLAELYELAEREALATVDWYLGSRQRKRRAARALRGGMLTGLTAGAALPLLEFTGAGEALAGWGYLALLGAALCAVGDRCFGVSSGWMRDMAAAQAVRRRLETLRYDWAAESVREVLGPAEGTESEAAERCLWVLRRFSEDLAELVRRETADWMLEFRCAPGPLLAQLAPAGAGAAGAGRAERCAAYEQVRGGPPAYLPRQRPPEGPCP
ncbi:SLATT domain-containing protein [Streptomyces carpaticus]|uniref:SLATT domain-containing protein n=1 Tax=Streptomyces carpaticus TaxID=285558 RepID=UPI00220361B3|nr:SLATT domain-containing protein [Streptomyces carpaticus]